MTMAENYARSETVQDAITELVERIERINTTLRLEPQLLEALKIVAARKRVRVNDLLLEGVRHVLRHLEDGET